ncbi:hypothetical protein [Catellatospora paridis]|uniref:hypothetical protein n=1 Tax=Catellatospora paridis TaxID=1617086 RepID=UPI0012D4BC0E|nr:hypothetical protein [Catellatospora paridis]
MPGWYIQSPDGTLLEETQLIYGLIHLDVFHSLLAAEEGIELRQYEEFGGSTSWEGVSSPLKDLLARPDRGIPATRCRAVLPTVEPILQRWSSGDFALHDIFHEREWMRKDQVTSLVKLVAMLKECVRTGSRLVLA